MKKTISSLRNYLQNLIFPATISNQNPEDIQGGLHEPLLLSEEIALLGQYGEELKSLNDRRREVTSSLSGLRQEFGLDTKDIKKHLAILYRDSVDEARKLTVVTKQLANLTRGLAPGVAPEVSLVRQINELDSRINQSKDTTIRDNLIETANSKTKTLMELGKIVLYKGRVETKITRLDAFLSEVQLGVMRSSLEDNNDYQAELTHSVKAIRSSFTAVDDFKSEMKLLGESEEKKDQEIPFYLRYKDVWSPKEDTQNPNEPGHVKQSDVFREEDLSSTFSPVTAVCPNCKEEIMFVNGHDTPASCPRCHTLMVFDSETRQICVATCNYCRSRGTIGGLQKTPTCSYCGLTQKELKFSSIADSSNKESIYV